MTNRKFEEVEAAFRPVQQMNDEHIGLPPTPPDTQRTRRVEKEEQLTDEDELAARNLMKLSSLSQSVAPRHSPSSRYEDHNGLPSFFDIVAGIPDYDEKSRRLASETLQPAQPGTSSSSSSLDPSNVDTRFQYYEPSKPMPVASSSSSTSYPSSSSQNNDPFGSKLRRA